MISFKNFCLMLEAVEWRDSREPDKKIATRVQFDRHTDKRKAERNVDDDEMSKEELERFYQQIVEKAIKDCKVSSIDDPQPYLIYSLSLRQGVVCVYQKGLFDYDGPNPHVFIKTWLPRNARQVKDPPDLKRKTKLFVIENKNYPDYIYLEID